MAPKYSSLLTGELAQSSSGRAPLLTEIDEDAMEGGDLEKWASPDRWQISTTDDRNIQTPQGPRDSLDSKINLNEKRPSLDVDEPNSPNEWSSSDNAPLLANSDESPEEGGNLQEEEKTPATAASTGEYQVAFSHFAVSFNN